MSVSGNRKRKRREGIFLLLVIVVAAVLAIGLVLALWLIPAWVTEFDATGEDLSLSQRIQSISLMRQMILWIAGGIIAIVTLILTWRRDRTARLSVDIDKDANFTNRYTEAVRQLGDDSFAIRLGGIYALERIARDSPRDGETILKVLAAFIRRVSPSENSPFAEYSAPIDRGVDVEAAGYVLAQVSKMVPESSPVDLSYTVLTDVDFSGANFPKANFVHSVINRSTFDRAKLDGANFSMADLGLSKFDLASLVGIDAFGANLLNTTFKESTCQKSNFRNSDMSGSNFDLCNLEDANLCGVKFLDTTFRNAKLKGADISGSNHSQADMRGSDLAEVKLNKRR